MEGEKGDVGERVVVVEREMVLVKRERERGVERGMMVGLEVMGRSRRGRRRWVRDI